MSSAADSLEELWLGGREGTLCPLESLKAFAFYTAYLEQGVSEKKVFVKVAEKVTKLGGGHPGSDAIRKFSKRRKTSPAKVDFWKIACSSSATTDPLSFSLLSLRGAVKQRKSIRPEPRF